MYAGLGVAEYFLYDPTGEHYSPRLRGYRLVDGGYERLTAVESIDRTLAIRSEVLGLEMWARGDRMRFRDPSTGENLLSYVEEAAARREEAAARREEAAARREEAAAYRAALARAEREAAARQAALARAEAAEARIAELEARLRDGR